MGYKLTGIFITCSASCLYHQPFSHWTPFPSVIFLSLLNDIYLQNDIYLWSDSLFHPQVTFLWHTVQMFGKDLLDRLEETKEKHTTDADFLVAVTIVLKDWQRTFSGFLSSWQQYKKLALLQHTHTFTFIKLILKTPNKEGCVSFFTRWAVLKTEKSLQDGHTSIMELDKLVCIDLTKVFSIRESKSHFFQHFLYLTITFIFKRN